MPGLSRRLTGPATRLVVLAWLVSLGLVPLGCSPPAEPQGPALAVVLVIDQLGSDRLDPTLPGGLGRVIREGRVFADALVDHADTETCPGHVAAATGRHPGPIGVPGNQFVDRDAGRVAYCVADSPEAARVHGGTVGRSPRLIGATALGDWLREARPGARVFSVSAKDRAAIALGGQRPDAAFWLDRKEGLGFTTSAWYLPALPEWLVRFNGSGATGGFLAPLPERWEHPSGNPANGARVDDHPREIDRFSRVSPHPVSGAERETTLEQLYASPFLDDVTLALTRGLVEAENVGLDEEPDLLLVSLSAVDVVGHFYGPASQEARDTLRRLDAALGRFLGFLELRVGRGRIALALTSDHGVLALPEWLAETGGSRCPVRGGRVDQRGLHAALEYTLTDAFGAVGADLGPWILVAGRRLGVNRPRAAAAGVSPGAVAEAARDMLEAQPVVDRVWTAAELEASGDGPGYARLYRNSHHPERGGDLVVQHARDCLISPYAQGTNHGTPHLYDRAVPLIFWGTGVEPGVVRGRARLVDVAPTLAGLLGVTPPPGLDGEPLPLR